MRPFVRQLTLVSQYPVFASHRPGPNPRLTRGYRNISPSSSSALSGSLAAPTTTARPSASPMSPTRAGLVALPAQLREVSAPRRIRICFGTKCIRPQWQMLRRLGGYALAALTRIAEEPSLPDGANQRAIRAHPGRRQRRGAGHEVRCRRARLASSIKHCVTLPGHVQKSWQRTRRTPPQDRPSTGMDFVYSETPSCLVRLSPVHWPPT
jgi:hypothetical protein